MKYSNLEDIHFHDSVINSVDYDGKVLIFDIPEKHFENALYNSRLKIQVDECDFSIIYIKQYPRFGVPRFKGKEISVEHLKALLNKGNSLVILEFLVSSDSELVIFECDIFPYSSGGGVYKKVIIRIDASYKDIELCKIEET